MKAGIVGMGVMGLMLARRFSEAGWEVSLFDKEKGEHNCSHTAAGLLTPYSELEKEESVIFDMGEESINIHWPNILATLPNRVYFKQTGSLVLHHRQDHAEWHHFKRRLLYQERNYQQMSSEDLLQLEPGLGKFHQAFYFPKDAHIDVQACLASLKKDLKEKGVTFFYNTLVEKLKPGQLTTSVKTWHFDLVIDARGLGARAVFDSLRAVRGELLWLHAPEVALKRPIRLLHPRYHLYIVPRADNIYLIGASEIEAEDLSPISVRTTLELLTAAFSMHAGFGEARILKTKTHCRPTLCHHLPRIYQKEGLVAVNGLYRYGFLIAPTLANEVLCAYETNFKSRKYPQIWEHNG
jgi:glycine oxidase